MSNRNLARRTVAEIAFDGVDITRSIRPYLLSVSYTDNEEDETDDLQITLQDRGRIWTEQWLMDAIEAAAAEKLSIEAVLLRENQHSNGKDVLLPFGTFELDTVEASGPPNKITIKATSLPFHAAIRQTKKSKAWEGYTLSGIANEMAANSGMICMYESSVNPYYARVEQIRTSDIALLRRLCHEAGISLKATNKILVLFDQAEYEAKDEILTIRRGDGSYTRYQIGTGTADTQYASCRVRYENPAKGQCITGIATDDKVKNGQQLEVAARVASPGEAKTLAEKMLRLHNKFAKTASFTMVGNPALVAGVTVRLRGFGGWDCKYIISQAVHTVDGSGYTTRVRLRSVLEGY